MALINIDDLVPGMKLEKDAIHDNGRVLLCAGTMLTEKHIVVFKTWGLTEADIEGVSREDVEASKDGLIDPQILKESENELRELFQHTDMEHPAIDELFRIRSRMHAQKKSEGSVCGDA